MNTQAISRRTLLKRFVQTGLGAAFLSMGGFYYAKYIEPKMLRTTKLTFVSPQLPESFNGLTITQFSDTHIGPNYSLKQFQKLVNKINQLNSDLVFFTGDLIDAPNEFHQHAQVTELMKHIRAPLGKFAIYGNHDHGGYGSELIKELMNSSGFHLLVNDHIKINKPNAEAIYIAGIDDLMLGRPDIDQTLHGLSKDSFVIGLAHEPDIADDFADRRILNIQLSGHSHGGQVQIPFFGPLITPPYATKYVEGIYPFPDSMMLYVNRGIGTTREPYRFLSIPELTVITLRTGSKQTMVKSSK